MNKYNKIIVLMKSAGRKVYVNKTPSATPVLIKEEQKVIPMDLDHPNPSIMSSLSPGQSINATLKGKNVKIVNKLSKEDKKPKIQEFVAPAMKNPPVYIPQSISFNSSQNSKISSPGAIGGPNYPKNFMIPPPDCFGNTPPSMFSFNNSPNPMNPFNNSGNSVQLDSNIAEISMDELSKQNALATGDPVFCNRCSAVFNSYSKIINIEEEQV